MPVESIAVGVLINDDNQVLIAKRAADKHQGNKWEFPGGKVEDDETSQEALQREMQEELGIKIQSAKLLTNVIHEYKDKKIILDVYEIKQWEGEAKGMEQQPLLWVEKHELDHYDFPAANTEILSIIS